MIRLGLGWIFIILSSLTSFSQVDTEFWFAPPEITSGHGDRPIFIRVSTLSQAANVQVLQPARGNIVLANVNVAANTTYTIDLTGIINFIEPSVAAQELKTGIRILSTTPVTAYYEVGSILNSDIFSLKGKNALGNKFIIPGQDLYNNNPNYNPVPSFSFDIVATRNNTVIKVKPTRPIFGHENATEITVKLNAGETYSFRKTSTSPFANPIGTIVESNKPIAITIKDDSVINGGCHDVLGDQIVPVEVTGSEYIVLRGFMSSTEYLFITAISNGTEIFVGGNPFPLTTLQTGQLYRVPIVGQATHVLTSHPVYALHVTGIGCEMGMALLPSVNCKGSSQIGFARTTTEFFGLNILVRKGGISNFKLNGSSTLIPSSAFISVPGSNDTWYAAQLSFNTSQISTNAASLISNDLYSFQLGILNGNDIGSSCRYGYFSAFSTLFIGDDFTMCEGETAMLDAGLGKEHYLWSTGSASQQIEISQPGTYWVRTEKEDCILSDTININVKTGSVNLGPDIQICEGSVATIDGKENFSWLWSDGSTSRFLLVNQPGKYWVTVYDYTGCMASDTILVTTKPNPKIDLGPDQKKCSNESVTLDATTAGAVYQWDDNTTNPIRTINNEGNYWCRVFANGCTSIDSIAITNHPGPQQDSIYGSPSVCPFVTEVEYRVEQSSNTTYKWSVAGGSIVYNDGSIIKINWGAANATALVNVGLTDSLGCENDPLELPVRINTKLIVKQPIGPDTLCLNKSSGVPYATQNTNGSVYTWFISGGEIEQGQGSASTIINWGIGLNTLRVEETSLTIDTVCTGTSPILNVYVFKDEATLSFNYVSVDTALESNIKIEWIAQPKERIRESVIILHKKISGQINWETTELPSNESSYQDQGNSPDENRYTYYLSFTNLCDEELFSNEHIPIQLTGSVNEEENVINLTWTPYEGWANGVSNYEIWRKLDDHAGYRKVSTVSEATHSVSVSTKTGFNHQYVIRAIAKSDAYESWSNNTVFSFDHEIFIPNIFTPNGDASNQFFEITNIELYKESHLIITNRWGNTVFESRGYANTWDGEKVNAGVYFYTLKLNNRTNPLKGSVTIIK